MRKNAKFRLISVTMLVLGFASFGNAQPSNRPSSQTQVGSAANVATTPSGYVTNGQGPLVNYVRERDAMGRITDTAQFATAGFMDVKQTTQYFDGLGRPLQTVQQQMTPGSSPADIVIPVVYDNSEGKCINTCRM